NQRIGGGLAREEELLLDIALRRQIDQRTGERPAVLATCHWSLDHGSLPRGFSCRGLLRRGPSRCQAPALHVSGECSRPRLPPEDGGPGFLRLPAPALAGLWGAGRSRIAARLDRWGLFFAPRWPLPPYPPRAPLMGVSASAT